MTSTSTHTLRVNVVPVLTAFGPFYIGAHRKAQPDGVHGPQDTANAEHTPHADATECRFKRFFRSEVAANATLYERLAKAGAKNISAQAEINRLRTERTEQERRHQVQARQINRLHDTIADLEDKLLAGTCCTRRSDAEVLTQNDALRAALTTVDDTAHLPAGHIYVWRESDVDDSGMVHPIGYARTPWNAPTVPGITGDTPTQP